MPVRVGQDVTFRPAGRGREMRGVVEAIHGDPTKKTTLVTVRAAEAPPGLEEFGWVLGESYAVSIGELEGVNVSKWAPQPREAPGEWIPVRSSNVQAIRWTGTPNETRRGSYSLQVKFLPRGGRPSSVYAYDVPWDIYDELFSASSKGKFIHYELIANRWPYRRIA